MDETVIGHTSADGRKWINSNYGNGVQLSTDQLGQTLYRLWQESLQNYTYFYMPKGLTYKQQENMILFWLEDNGYKVQV